MYYMEPMETFTAWANFVMLDWAKFLSRENFWLYGGFMSRPSDTTRISAILQLKDLYTCSSEVKTLPVVQLYRNAYL